MFKKAIYLPIAIAFLAYGCQCDCDNAAGSATTAVKTEKIITESAQRGKLDVKTLVVEKFDRLPLAQAEGQIPAEVFKEPVEALAEADRKAGDAAFSQRLLASLMGADNKQKELPVTLSMSPEPVQEGYFLFGVNAKDAQELEFEIYEAQSLELVAQNKMSLTPGNNYKAVNLKTFEDGYYIFRLYNEAGQEVSQRLQVLNETVQ
ncbi:hypothetical protein PPO43_04570 [Saprospira sp. CCB-QB6]|uniref:hypothetical protein n=1 Tax=Saprospira sp. CCB-QB6 TaxID=3023936 RepID=UPI00234A3A9C|nr:hypothetical protein [Saprospira sp. CCB-QB6]WCL82374.1 hypothetical protein PPO43_04570 [Saprospira sp. CCB-QB6]